METFTAEDAEHRFTEVLQAALRGPVVITVRGAPAAQVMTVEAAIHCRSPARRTRSTSSSIAFLAQFSPPSRWRRSSGVRLKTSKDGAPMRLAAAPMMNGRPSSAAAMILA